MRLSEAADERMRAVLPLKWSLIEQGIPIYGVTTGFGDSCIRQIGADKAHELQRNLVLYHLNGTGPAAVARGRPGHHDDPGELGQPRHLGDPPRGRRHAP